MRRLFCSAATALTLLALSPAVQASTSGDPPGTGEVITLNFDWSKPFRGQVRHAMLMTQISQGKQNRVAIDMRYEMSSTPTPTGLLIRTENVKTAVNMADAPGGGDPIRKFMTRLASQSPAYLVGKDGRFLRIHDLPGFRKTMIGAVDEWFGGMAPAPMPATALTQLRQMIGAMFTESTLHATASTEWDVYVGGWRNLRLKTGELREFMVKVPVPVLGNVRIPMYGSVLLRGRTPCRDRGRIKGCVELLMRVTAGEKEMAAAMKAYLQKVSGGTQRGPLRRIRQTRAVRIVCNPATLVPYASDSRNETIVFGDGEDPTLATIREERLRYSY